GCDGAHHLHVGRRDPARVHRRGNRRPDRAGGRAPPARRAADRERREPRGGAHARESADARAHDPRVRLRGARRPHAGARPLRNPGAALGSAAVRPLAADPRRQPDRHRDRRRHRGPRGEPHDRAPAVQARAAARGSRSRVAAACDDARRHRHEPRDGVGRLRRRPDAAARALYRRAADSDRRRHRRPRDRLRRAEPGARRHLRLLSDPRGSGAHRRPCPDQRDCRHRRADQPAHDRAARRRRGRAGVSQRHDYGACESEQAVRVRDRRPADRLRREHRPRVRYDPRSRHVDGKRPRVGAAGALAARDRRDRIAGRRRGHRPREVQDAAAQSRPRRERAAAAPHEHVGRPRDPSVFEHLTTISIADTVTSAMRTPALALCLLALTASASAQTFTVPVVYNKLPNGLRVVVSENHAAPVVIVEVMYRIGFRIEPRNRTGFAHLFEHMMFQGSEHVGKFEHVRIVNENGGTLNGSTRFDHTNYFEVMPSNALELAMWLEADRMRSLKITPETLKNQQDVVSEEVRVNVLNQPYGAFEWLGLPQKANTNWYNAHNFYGDLKDLQAATLDDVKKFFDTYYAPNNAVLVVSRDTTPDEVMKLASKHFAGIPSRTLPPRPDIKEPQQTAEKTFGESDKLARTPALAFGYHLPERMTKDFFALSLLDPLLVSDESAKLYQALIKEKQVASNVSGGINLLGNNFDYNGPMLYTFRVDYRPDLKGADVLKVVDKVIAAVQEHGITEEELRQAKLNFRSSFLEGLES